MARARWLAFASAISIMAVVLASPALGQSASGAPSSAIFDYTLTNEGGIRFADEYQRLGGVDTLGYPASYRFQLPDGFTYQLSQGALLQWRPERDGVMLANTFEMLEKAGLDNWLYSFKGIPRPIKDDGSGGDWNKAKDIRLSWLTHEAITARYLANPNPEAIPAWNVDRSIELYGLPMSYPERFGPFITQRFQRIAFQLWLDEVPGMPPPGAVVRVLAGDLMKEAGLIPLEALAPGDRPTPTPTATPVAVLTTPVLPAPTATPTPRAVPTPDPAHPPQTGTFTVIWSEVPTISTCESLLARKVGPYLNLAFTENYVGKTLMVTRDQVICRPDRPPERCGWPAVSLYRSLVGEIGSATWSSSSGCINDERNAIFLGDYSYGPWKIEYGQYFIHFAVRPGSPTTPFLDPPISFTYTIAIAD